MPNIASVFKDEVARIARKEIRGEITALKRANVRHRSEIAALKRHAAALEKLVRSLSKSRSRASPAAPDTDSRKTPRFSAKGLVSQRKRLGLSAAELGLLLGVSGQSIYLWEQGKTRPRAAVLPAIAGLKGLGKKEAMAVVEARAASK